MVQVHPVILTLAASAVGIIVGIFSAIAVSKATIRFLSREFELSREENRKVHEELYRRINDHEKRISTTEGICDERGKTAKC